MGIACFAGMALILAALGFASTRRSPKAALAYAINALLLAAPPVAFLVAVRFLA